MKAIHGGSGSGSGGSGFDLIACTCPDGKVYYVSPEWNCKDVAKHSC